MTNIISAFTYEGGEKISVQPITQDITKAVRAVDLNSIAEKLNEIIDTVNVMNTDMDGPQPSLVGITVNGTIAAIENGIAHITIDSFTPEEQTKLARIAPSGMLGRTFLPPLQFLHPPRIHHHSKPCLRRLR